MLGHVTYHVTWHPYEADLTALANCDVTYHVTWHPYPRVVLLDVLPCVFERWPEEARMICRGAVYVCHALKHVLRMVLLGRWTMTAASFSAASQAQL